MDSMRWIIAGLLVALSLFLVVSQWLGMYSAKRRLKADLDARGYSVAPLIGGALGAIGMLIAPAVSWQRLWWIPLIVDPGCALLLGAVVVFGVGGLIRRFFA